MVNGTLNKNEYRLTFITTLINNWYTIFYKHNHHQSHYNNDTKESLQITKLKDTQERLTNILVPLFTLTTTSYASLSNKSSTLAPLLDIIPIAWVQLLDTISTILITKTTKLITTLLHKTSPKVKHDVTLVFFFPLLGLLL